MEPESTLNELVAQFGVELTETIRAVSPDCSPFKALTSDIRGDGNKVRLVQRPDTGITLNVAGRPLLQLTVEYHCTFDRDHRYLAVDKSQIQVRAVEVNEPLFRYEYERHPTGNDFPTAHIHVHAHRDAFIYVMTEAGDATRRAKLRVRSKKIPTLSQLHFPVGGSRFRPCLEDVIEMLVQGFGIDHQPGPLEILRSGRERWRKMQLAAAVRDAPELAATALEVEFGYQITRPYRVPKGSPAKLRQL